MTNAKRQISKRAFWGIIVLGAILPMVTQVIIGAIFDPTSIVSLIFKSNPLFLAIINVIPFIALALLAKWKLNNVPSDNISVISKRLYSVIGAGVTTISVSLLINFSVWINLFSDDPSSTAGIALVFIPIYAIIVMPIGYLCGKLAGSLILRVKSER